MVGRPWGQHQGCSMVERFLITLVICALDSALPIMMDMRHARDANMARLLGRRSICMTPNTHDHITLQNPTLQVRPTDTHGHANHTSLHQDWWRHRFPHLPRGLAEQRGQLVDVLHTELHGLGMRQRRQLPGNHTSTITPSGLRGKEDPHPSEGTSAPESYQSWVHQGLRQGLHGVGVAGALLPLPA
jgi:hypothetical protein